MIKLERRVEDLELDGIKYVLKHPSVEDMSEYTKKQASKDDDLTCLIWLLDRLGLPKKIGMTLELPMVQQLVEVVLVEKK